MKCVPFREPEEVAAAIPTALTHLRAAGVLAHPTETVYGLGTTLDPAALDALARLKQREPNRPFLLLVAEPAHAPGLDWPAAAHALAAAFWPGPLTLALPARPGAYPAAVTAANGTVAIRATAHTGMRALLRALRAPITSTSANPAGQPPARSPADVTRVLHEMSDRDRFGVVCLDGGVLAPAAPSTIVDCGAARPRVVRAGAIALEELRAVVEEIDD